MRMTRAAMRARADEDEVLHDPFQKEASAMIHEDLLEASNKSTGTPPNTTEQAVRPALRDITGENYPQADTNVEVELAVEPSTTKKGRGRVKNRKNTAKNQVMEVPAVDQPETTTTLPLQLTEMPESRAAANTPTIQLQCHTPQTSEMGGVSDDAAKDDTPAKSVQMQSKTPKFDPDLHITGCESDSNAIDDSFVDSIITRSPSKLSLRQTRDSSRSDSLRDRSLSRSTPLRRVSSSRIEDSVEAMDALEDAIEQVTADLPILDSPDSPVRSLKANTPSNAARVPSSSARERTPLFIPQDQHLTPSKSRTPSRTPSNSSKKPAAKTPTSRAIPARDLQRTGSVKKPAPEQAAASPRLASQSSETSADPSLSSSTSPAKQESNQVKRRVNRNSALLSTNKPGFVPTKSTKPPTASTFSLPGEAVAAKLKADREAREERMKNQTAATSTRGAEIAAKMKAQREAREERLKKQREEAEQAKSAPKPKARPVSTIVPARPSIVPRENKASLARRSMMLEGSNKENVAPRPKPTVNVNKIRTDANKTTAGANTGVKRAASTTAATTKRPSVNVNHERVASLSSGKGSTVTAADLAKQHAKGKEVLARAKMTLQQEQEEKRAKEDAARKARAEAAERGRQASREWAEKQKKRLADQAVLKAK